jgi:prepilin-type N-terminal cleavage/methylation domain-containing protein
LEKLITNQKGVSIVEILIAITIFAIFSVGAFYLSVDALHRDAKIELDNVALSYAQEGIEAMRNIRDRNFLLLTNGDHGLEKVNGSWQRIPAPENIDDFYFRTIVVSDVFRDDDGNIAEIGTFDPDTKKIVSRINWEWRDFFSQSVSITAYLSNWGGVDFVQMTCGDFETGNLADTVLVDLDGPPEDNCGVVLDIEEPESTFLVSANVGNHANDVTVDGNYAFVSNDKNHNGLSAVDTSDKENPVILSEINVGDRGLYVKKQNNYVYVGVRSRNGGLVIVDVSNPSSMSIVSTLNVGQYGNQIDLKGNYLYMGTANSKDSLKVVYVSNKSAPSIVKSIDFKGIVRSVKVYGDYLFVGLENDKDSFHVFDISNSASPVFVTKLDLGEQVNDIEIQGFYAYVGIENTGASLKILNVANPENPVLIKTLNIGAEIEAIAISGNYLYAALDDQNAGMAVVNISDPASAYLVHNSDVTGKATGIASDGPYVYITTRTNNRGLVIKGSTVSTFNVDGEFISNAFDSGSSDTRYNYISWESEEPAGTSIKFQLRTASTSGGLSSAQWAGEDGTSSTFYNNPRTMITTAPDAGLRYFQYKAIMESDGISSPTLESVLINYSP